MKAATKQVNILNLQVGNIVHFHGARFEITSVRDCTSHFRAVELGEKIISANGKWIDGEIVTGYFGPNKDWGFQGNANVSHSVEI